MPDNLPAKLTSEQITGMCERGFGNEVQIESIRELGGGTFNETYLVELIGKTVVILRVAPPPHADVYWDDVALMRREHHILPFFASVAPWMPKVIMVDFTHQVVERDYVFQTYIAGERWSDIEDELAPDEDIELWRQCGEIVKRMHETAGERFGYPPPGRAFSRWSETVLDRFARIGESMLAHQLEATAFTTISEVAGASASLLDEIDSPRLLHGDLWTFNLIVRRDGDRPTIAGVLDVDRAWWGDPMADWIMFLLAIRQDQPEWQPRLSAFYDGYGAPESGEAARLRQEIYKAMHIGLAAVWCSRNGDEESVARAYRDLGEIARSLSHSSR
ncbi:MAG TPA: aminoglycoside phosphotransferase family protein [Anaerolineae bacterium]|nr:aminoglycoside phosphotransferase family protein [Anaerolineae bacterium]